MDKELIDYVAERVDILAAADTSKQDTKDAALAWKAAADEGRVGDVCTRETRGRAPSAASRLLLMVEEFR